MKLPLIPDRTLPIRIWAGPFRGARVVLNPRHSLRKILGLYEHELNSWLDSALRHVERVIDVGANDGYFTFGCVGAFARQRRQGKVMAFEPGEDCVRNLRASLTLQDSSDVSVELVKAIVGRTVGPGVTTLDVIGRDWPRQGTLIKIDVEGAELDVIAGAQSWLEPSNIFLIEVHKRAYIDQLERIFTDRGLHLTLIAQRALPFIGGEERAAENCWLVSSLSQRTA
jgi:hypothetical protein